MQAAQDDPSLKKEKKVGYSIAGSLSLFLHLGLFLLIGGTVIVEQIIPKQAMTGEVQVSESMVDSPVEETPEEMPQEDVPQPTDVTEQSQSSSAEASPFDMNTITVDSPTPSFNVPTLGVASATPGLPGTGAGGGTSTTGSATAKKPINIFGAKTEAKKLGVILDCSGSAHAYLLAAFKEVDKNFEDAPTVLAMGCGMGATKEKVEVELYGKIKPDKDRDKPGSRTILGQLANAETRYKDLERYLDRMKKRSDVWAIYGGDVNATGFGFEELIKQGVDTIYWFSDLQDAVNPAMIEKLTGDLKRKGIKVIVHNFSGGKIPPLQQKMADETGGMAISKKPN
jgi:hypothetical protein